MRELDAEFLEAELEPLEVRSEQVREEQRAEEMPAGENRRHPPRIARVPHDDEGLEPARLRIPQALVHLREAAEKDEQHRDAEQPDGETE